MTSDRTGDLKAFFSRWEISGASEKANAQSFINELCDVLEVDRPQPKRADEAANAYVFEKSIPSITDTTNFIDCYRRGCFVLETKQGVEKDTSTPLSKEGEDRKKGLKAGHGQRGSAAWQAAMLRAREQAQRYARALPKEETADGRPPFVIVVDVGHSIGLYTDWSRMGGEYVPFPDPATFRILLKDLERAEVRQLLQAVWNDPLSLDPGRRSAKVTREIADRLARLARSLEGQHTPEEVAGFLMRCLFTMFSEDVDLLPHGSFTKLLGELKGDPSTFADMLESLWGTMNTGGLSPILRKKLPQFNGGLFAHADAIDLNQDQIQLLIEASTANWKDVEPAIFGTLLERALDPRERHKLGAHYTPRAYVERLVNPTVIEPLREQWKSVQVAALQLAEAGDRKKAIQQIEKYLYELGNVRVLDPACGSGNFLYVTLELLKRLEGEVLNTLAELGQAYKLEYNTHTISPANFLGIEVNPRAAAIAEQVLWIGFLQWQLRTHGDLHKLPEPIIKDLHNIQCRDAVLECDGKSEQRDANGQVVTRWDGQTTKPHPVTGEEVPDPEARVPVYTYSNPRPAKWPQADYIVGNPPFIGNKRMRLALGDGYTEALREGYAALPATVDFVMYWWDKAAHQLAEAKVKRFGFITTNSITQPFNRVVVEEHLSARKPISLLFAIADHPWVDSTDGAAVRIAMTVATKGKVDGAVARVISETELSDGGIDVVLDAQNGKVHPNLQTGSDVTAVHELQSNGLLSGQGVIVLGEGFQLDQGEFDELKLSAPSALHLIKRYLNGKDLMHKPRGLRIIDLFGMSEADVKKYPKIYQRIYDRVRPGRLEMKDKARREKWWLFGRSNKEVRDAIAGLKRYIATCRTATHRVFMFIEGDVLPDAKIVAIGLDDAYSLGVLSSRFHNEWAMKTGGWLGVGNDSNYNHSDCFGKFPFPNCTNTQKERIQGLGEELDAHRKRQQATHPQLTMTGMYNVLEAVRAGTPLSTKEKGIYEQGLIGVLKQLHDDLDAAVAEAYGWPANLSSDEILSRLVALNAERAAEEARGLVRWLRPEYQAKGAAKGTQAKIDVEDGAEAPDTAAGPRAWPEELPEQAAVLSEVLKDLPAPATIDEIATRFEGRRTRKRLEEMERLLETLRAVGRAVRSGSRWSAGK